MSTFLFLCLLVCGYFLFKLSLKINKLQSASKKANRNEVALEAAENELQFLKKKLTDFESTEESFNEGIKLSQEKNFVDDLKNKVTELEQRDQEMLSKLAKAKADLAAEANTKEQDKEKLKNKILELELNEKKAVEQLVLAKNVYLTKLRDVLDREKSIKEKLESSSSSIQSKLHEVLTRENQTGLKMIEAKDLMAQAQKLKADAEKHVETTKNENKVYHEAIEEIVNLWVNDS